MADCNLKPLELTLEQLDRITPLLKPGYFCSYGFMNKDDVLVDIYNKDMTILNNHNITPKQIADVLTSIVQKYRRKAMLIGEENARDCGEYSPEIKKYHYDELLQIDRDLLNLKCNNGYNSNSSVHSLNPIIIDKKYLVTCISYWGFQPCPFYCFCEITHRSDTGGGDDFWVYDLETKKTLEFNDLLIHLIGNHHFFEGNVHHRLNPETIIDFFNLQPNIDYSSEFIEVSRWIRLNEGGDNTPCYNFGPTNEVNITHSNEDTVIIECVQRTYSQKVIAYLDQEFIKNNQEKVIDMFNIEKHEYVFCEFLVDGLPIRHRLDLKKVSTYNKKKVKYVPVIEETLFPKKYYGDNLVFTTVSKSSYSGNKLVNGEREFYSVTKTLVDKLELYKRNKIQHST